MKRTICSLLSLCACLSATAADFAFNFNTESDFKIWRIASQKLEPLTPAKDYAIFSLNCLRFKTPKWEKGMPEWPSCEAKPRIADWTEYDRLLIDITNPNPEMQRLSLFISDSKIPFRQALGDGFNIEGNGTTRCVVDLSKFPKNVNRKDISILHLFTQRPEANMDLFIADIMLLKKGEKLPVVYLLHGLSDNQNSWSCYSSIGEFVKGKNVIVVMPDGERSFYTDIPNFGNFFSYITKELPD